MATILPLVQLYTNKSCLADAVLVKVVHDTCTKHGAFPVIKDHFKEDDLYLSQSMLDTVPAEISADLLQKAIFRSREPGYSTQSLPA